MSLFKNKTTTGAKFEPMDGDVNDGNTIEGTATVVQETTQQVQPNQSAQDRLKAAAAEREAEAAAEREAVAATKTETPAAGTSLAAKKPGALAVAVPRPEKIFAPLEDAFHVDWNTLEALKATQGQFLAKADDSSFGPEIGFELLSHQKQFVVSTNTDAEEDNKLVRYSDDGITCNTGEDVKEYRQHLIDAGFPEAGVSERVVLVGSLFDPGTKPECKDKLMQISLAPTSKAFFDRHQLQTTFNVQRKTWSPEGVTRLRMTCKVQSKGKLSWTQVNFTKYDL
jgi:hypothetical protein